MLNKNVLSAEVQQFINENLHSDITKILLKKSPFSGVSSAELAEQITAKLKCKNKLPLWFNTPNLIFPNKISVEQASSEATAAYKSKLAQGTLLDATGGMGVDSFYFSKSCQKVIHCEYITEIQQVAQHNFRVLKAENITSINSNFTDYLTQNQPFFNYIYLDPARRNNAKEKVFLLKDCQPNVPELLHFLWQYTQKIIVKVAPILDIQAGINELKKVSEIHIVALQNEVKELLFILEKEANPNNIQIKTSNILPHSKQEFSFFINENEEVKTFSEPLSYLYEPNASIMKSGGFAPLQKKYNFFKLATHSHLFTSETFFPNFEGRTFKIHNIIPFSKQLKNEILPSKLNITTRNFPLSVAEIREKFKWREGGDTYLFFTTNSHGKKLVLVCEKHI